MAHFTVFGGNGFIGQEITQKLRAAGHKVTVPSRDQFSPTKHGFGHVIWCIGLTADFRTRPHDTLEAHCTLASKVISQNSHKSFLYLSSTRVYSNSTDGKEDSHTQICLDNYDDLYNSTKLTGELITLVSAGPNAKVVRLSNVVGPMEWKRQTFLGYLIRGALSGKVSLDTDLSTEKDYIWIGDVSDMIFQISIRGVNKVYNLARGKNISHGEWINQLKKNFHFQLTYNTHNKGVIFPYINVDRLEKEFRPTFQNPIDHMQEIVSHR